MRIDSKSKEYCCGCGACVSICSHNAITMNPDALWFDYPRIDNLKCIDCGLCMDVCQFKSNYYRGNNYQDPNVYALRLKSEQELFKSQSGGAFYVLSKYVIENNGVVFGAAFANTRKVKHIKVSDIEELDRIRRSKYVQSDLKGIFDEVRNELKMGKSVLFSGTPCQVAGLKKLINPNLSKKLYLVDIICHGVPSPKIWSDNIDYLENKYNSTIIKANFRDKRYGWNNAKETYQLVNGRNLIRHTFLDLYFGHYVSRECCTVCPYTNLRRVGDITIGDFWGWHKSHKEFMDDKGISLVLVNSDKGVNILNSCKNSVVLIESNTSECMQSKLKYPAEENAQKSVFMNEYLRRGFSHVLHKYTDEGWLLKLKIRIAKLINLNK